MFSGILVAEQKRDILLRTIALARQNIEILQTQVRLGGALELDLAQAELELLSLEITLTETETSLEDSRYQMKKLLSLDPADSLELIGTVDQDYAGMDLSGLEGTLFSMAAGYSPDLKRQGAAVQKASIQVRAASFPFIPDVDLELTAAFTGEAFPLGNPQYSGKLTFSFPVPESPTTYSAGASTTPGKDRGGSMSVKTSPLESVTAWVDRKTAGLVLDAEVRKKEQITQDLRFQVTRMMAAYSQAGRASELARRKLDVQRRKETILQRQMDLGEVKRIDYLQGAIETANAEIALNESVLRLRENERGLGDPPRPSLGRAAPDRGTGKGRNEMKQVGRAAIRAGGWRWSTGSCAQGESRRSRLEERVPVTTVVVKEQSVPREISCFGTITFPRKIDLSATVDGTVARLFVKEGQAVQAKVRTSSS